jgi:hypothetical protein
MTDLVQFGAAVLTQWRAEGGRDHDAIAVGDLLDRVLPYRVARRTLGIDMSEDYEALILRLLAGEAELVSVMPPDAGERARITIESKLPDLEVLQSLRPASMTFSKAAIRKFGSVAVASPAKDEIPVGTTAPVATAAAPLADVPPVEATNCWSCDEPLPESRAIKVLPILRRGPAAAILRSVRRAGRARLEALPRLRGDDLGSSRGGRSNAAALQEASSRPTKFPSCPTSRPVSTVQRSTACCSARRSCRLRRRTSVRD